MSHQIVFLLLAVLRTHADPLTTGAARRHEEGGHAASHFDAAFRATSTEPWSAQAAHDWHILEYTHGAGEARGYNDKTGEIFHEVGPRSFGIGTACTECLLFDLGTCGVLTPNSLRQQPHALVPYDREQRNQLWKVTNMQAVRSVDLPPGFLGGQSPHPADQTWHITSERDDTIEMTVFASLPVASMLQTTPARQLRCLSGWCLGWGSKEGTAFLATLMLIPLPRAFLDAEQEDNLHRSWPCETLSRAALVYVEGRAASPDSKVRGGVSAKPRAQIFANVKRAAQLASLAAELLAPVTGVATVYFKSAKGQLDDSQKGPAEFVHPPGLCDAPHDGLAASALETSGTVFTPEYINVTRPVRAIGHYCVAILGCVLRQVDWVLNFLGCLDFSDPRGTQTTNIKSDAMIVRDNARKSLRLLETLLSEDALQLAHASGFTPVLLADQISITTEDASVPVFELAKVTSSVFAKMLSNTPKSKTRISKEQRKQARRARVCQLACCYIKAGEPDRECTLS